jgi:MscS family membrane protein
MKLMSHPDWIRLLTAFAIFLGFLLFRKWLAGFVFRLLENMSGTSLRSRFASLLVAIEKPVHSLLIVVGVNAAYYYYHSETWPHWPLFQSLTRSALIAIFGWALLRLSERSSALFTGITTRFGMEESSMLIPFLSKMLRFLILALAVTMISSEWGYSINGFVAGLGLGSLALALAAKDTLSNFISGVIIITEKPFSRGDWIQTDSIEGVVEDISFRSSKIRTFADSVVTVPNSILAGQAITNWSRMGKRRISFTLGLAVDTDRERLSTVIVRLRELLQTHEEIDPETLMVRFNEFNSNHLGLFFYFFTRTTDWEEYLRIREEINFAIMDILREEQVRLSI